MHLSALYCRPKYRTHKQLFAGLEERRPGHSPGPKCILASFNSHRFTERCFLHLYADALSSSHSVSFTLREGKAEVLGVIPPPAPTHNCPGLVASIDVL